MEVIEEGIERVTTAPPSSRAHKEAELADAAARLIFITMIRILWQGLRAGWPAHLELITKGAFITIISDTRQDLAADASRFFQAIASHGGLDNEGPESIALAQLFNICFSDTIAKFLDEPLT